MTYDFVRNPFSPPQVTFGDLVDRGEAEIRTGPFGTQLRASDYVAAGVAVLNVRNLGYGDIRDEKVEFVEGETITRLQGHMLRAGDIVFGRKGAVERHAYIPVADQRWMQGSDCIRLRVLGANIDSRYLSYSLLTEYHKQWMMAQCSHGSTMASLNQEIVRRILVPLPPLPIQRRIASILSAYDDLIENNTRRIAILEEMAQAIYREWFVHFRYPGHEDVPLVDSPLGPIPEGWSATSLVDIVEINPKVKVPKGEPVPFVPMSSLSTDSMIIDDVSYRAGASGAKFQNGDTLLARITPCLENGKTGFVQFLSGQSDVACGSTEFIVLRSRVSCPEYVYVLARDDQFRAHAIASMTGATGRQRVQDASLRQYEIARSPQHLFDAFHVMVKPMFDLIHVLSRANASLRSTRDLLLPKLISGQIDVSADLSVEEMEAHLVS